ncbi:MAG: putative prolyl-tRNA synthetase, prolyl-tRNA synthetase [Candidatus Nomurabacteria bacterium]|nr:putative prolyl-tRNA synthetase, prolyl-tRNA synthetase [Candidatus Nomurabacteria bacterium]
MRQTQLFTKTSKDNPSDEVSKNAQLLIRAGYIHKEMAGVYSILPLGYRVMEKIIGIVKQEMDAIGGIQMKTSAIQSKEVWEKTNRWSDDVVDNWFKTTLKNGTEVGLSFTNEEAYSNIVKNFVSSYKDLPLYPYDFKTIFRNETRSKSGIMRGREFYWKALYSFSADQEQHDLFYEKAKVAYSNVYKRVGLGDSTYMTFASGGTFSKYSHEFQTVSEAGEDLIYIDEAKGIAINKEVFTDDVLAELGIDKSTVIEKKAIEVGNIFSLGFKFSEPFELTYKTAEGTEVPVFMGSYGIGITRLMGTIVEVLSDEKGIVWPETVAPFKVHLLSLGDTAEQAESIYSQLLANGIEVLFDDRQGVSAGAKFADSDLLGIPHRVVVSDRSLAQGGLEYKQRTSTEATIVSVESLIQQLTA